MKSLTEVIGSFVQRLSLESLSADVLDKAKTCIVNGIGMGVASHSSEFAKIARNSIKAEETGVAGEGSATLFCDGAKASVTGAAFANACLFHGRAQEDTLGTSHAGTVVLPATLAVAERERSSGKEVIEAVVAGYEVIGAFDREVAAYTTPRGFRATSIFGIFGAAAAASRLLMLSEEQTTHALGLAASFAGGTLECFSAGTPEWRFQVGAAAKGGILASLLARNGAEASRTAIEGKFGFLQAFANAGGMSEKMSGGFGIRWEILNAGFKPYPVCAFNQTPVVTTVEMVGEKGLDSREIRRVRVRMNPYEAQYAGINNKGPFKSLGETLMSTQFCVACTIVYGNLSIDDLARYDDSRICELVGKIDVVPDDRIPRWSCIIEADTHDGKMVIQEKIIPFQYYNYSFGQCIRLIKKVTSETGVGTSKVDNIISLIEELPNSASIQPLVDILSQCP